MTEQDAKYLMIAAIEGGINYWMNEECSNVEVKSVSKGFSEFEECPTIDEVYYQAVEFDYEGKHYTVSLERMIQCADEFTRKYKHLPIDEDHDAESADAFFQFCAFNEIIFG